MHVATSQRFGVTREASGWSDDVMYHSDDERDAGIASDLIKIKRRDEAGIFWIETTPGPQLPEIGARAQSRPGKKIVPPRKAIHLVSEPWGRWAKPSSAPIVSWRVRWRVLAVP